MNLFQNDCITLVSCNQSLMYTRNLIFNIMYSMCNIKNCKYKCTRNLMAQLLIRYQTICTSFLRSFNVFHGIVSISFIHLGVLYLFYSCWNFFINLPKLFYLYVFHILYCVGIERKCDLRCFNSGPNLVLEESNNLRSHRLYLTSTENKRIYPSISLFLVKSHNYINCI